MTKVLLVEDDNNLREIYEARLAAEGYEISTASDGEDALAVAKQVKPDLIISDVMMPRISGFEMLDILRNTDGLKHVKVIMLTALGQAEDKTRADSLGADRYLVKSQVTLEDIVKAADELLNPDAHPAEEVAPPAASAAPAAVAPGLTPTAAPVEPDLQLTPQPAPQASPVVPPVEPVAPAPAAPTPAAPAPEPPFAVPDLTATPAAQPTPDPAASPVAAPAAPSVPEMPVAEVPAIPVAETPAVGATASQEPDPVIQMPHAPLDPEIADATADVQSASQETAAIEKQIEDFVNTAPVTTPEVQPVQETPVPAPEAPPANHDDLLNNAVNDLLGSQQPAPAAESAAVETIDAPAANARQNFGQRVVQPPASDNTRPDLGALLAQEEAKTLADSGLAGQPIIGDVTKQPDTPPVAPPAGPGAPPTQAAPHTPGGVFMPNQNGSADEHAL